LGVAAQITNDIQGILDVSGSRNDIYQRKKSLPVIYAWTHGDSHSHITLESIYDQRTQVTPDMEREAKSVLLRVGAIHYAVLVAEVFRQRALSDLRMAQAAGADVRRLKAMIDW
jgi:geranylgeranyl pyrophosphate synthase